MFDSFAIKITETMLIIILPSLVNIRLPLKGSVCVKLGCFKVGLIKMHISVTCRVQWLGTVCHQISVKTVHWRWCKGRTKDNIADNISSMQRQLSCWSVAGFHRSTRTGQSECSGLKPQQLWKYPVCHQSPDQPTTSSTADWKLSPSFKLLRVREILWSQNKTSILLQMTF